VIDRDVTVKTPRFDRNRPIAAAVTTETVSSEVPRVATRPSLWMTAGLLVAGLAAGWLMAWLAGGRSASPADRQELIAGLRDARPDVRAFAARALGEAGPEAHEAVPGLIAALADDNQHVRIAAVKALAKAGTSQEAGPELRKVQQRDEDATVRDAAAEAQKLLKQESGSSVIGWIVLGLVLVAGGGGGFWFWKKTAEAEKASPARGGR